MVWGTRNGPIGLAVIPRNQIRRVTNDWYTVIVGVLRPDASRCGSGGRERRCLPLISEHVVIWGPPQRVVTGTRDLGTR